MWLVPNSSLYLKFDTAPLLIQQWKIQKHGLGPEAFYIFVKNAGEPRKIYFLSLGHAFLSKRLKDVLGGSVLP